MLDEGHPEIFHPEVMTNHYTLAESNLREDKYVKVSCQEPTGIISPQPQQSSNTRESVSQAAIPAHGAEAYLCIESPLFGDRSEGYFYVTCNCVRLF